MATLLASVHTMLHRCQCINSDQDVCSTLHLKVFLCSESACGQGVSRSVRKTSVIHFWDGRSGKVWWFVNLSLYTFTLKGERRSVKITHQVI